MHNNNQKNIFDFAVIGAGSGGLAAARRAAKYGKKVVIFECSSLGGTCVNLGCVPKKITFYASAIASSMNHLAPYYSFKTTSSFDWKTFTDSREKAVKRLNSIYQSNLDKEGISIIRQKVYLKYLPNNSNNSEPKKQKLVYIETEEGEAFHAKEILIATGSSPNIPKNLTESELSYISYSDAVFEKMKTKPKRVVIVGAGYIGVEFAFMFANLGVEVIFIIRRELVLCRFDRMIQETVVEELLKHGIKLIKNSSISEVCVSSNDFNNNNNNGWREKDRKNKYDVKIVSSGFGDSFEENLNLFDSSDFIDSDPNVENQNQKNNYNSKEEKYCKVNREKKELSIKGCDFVIYAIGRSPNLSPLSKLLLPNKKSNSSIPLNSEEQKNLKAILNSGKIPNDKNYCVSLIASNLWALGDIIGGAMLTPVAIKQGRLLSDKLFAPFESSFSSSLEINNEYEMRRNFEPLDLSLVPSVVFSHPPVGAIGLTGREAKEKFGSDKIGIKESSFDGMIYDVAKVQGADRKDIHGNKVKIVFEKESGKILGLHLVGSFADEALQGFSVAIGMGAKLDDFRRCIAIHPTSSEDVVLI